MESRRARVKRKICDADEVPVRDAIAMALQGYESSLDETRSDLGTFGPSGWHRCENGPGKRRRRQTGEGHSGKKATGNQQDLAPRRS
jgi:hypothetical protein